MMSEKQAPTAIPQDEAYQICAEIRALNRRRPYRVISALWCWGCTTFTKTPEQRCGGMVDCPQVVAYHKRHSLAS